MACAATAAGKDANSGTNSGLVTSATGAGASSSTAAAAAAAAAAVAGNSSSVAGAVGGVGAVGGNSASSGVVPSASRVAAVGQSTAGAAANGVVTNRQSRFAMEGVGARVIRGPDWKWGKQVGNHHIVLTINMILLLLMEPIFQSV